MIVECMDEENVKYLLYKVSYGYQTLIIETKRLDVVLEELNQRLSSGWSRKSALVFKVVRKSW